MQYEIRGEIAQHARLDLQPGEAAWASKGSLMAYSQDLGWRLRVPGGASGAVRRTLAGEGISLTYIEAKAREQYALLTANSPGHIIPWDLAEHGPVVATRGAFLAAWGRDVNIDVTIAKRAGAAFFGGAGLFLQRVSGQGTVLIHGAGDFQERRLERGEELNVSTGNLAAFGDQVDYSIKGVGGCGKFLFGGEGLFMTRLTGPGYVLLQSLKRRGGNAQAGAAAGA
jgi:uncharacterized protein (TIGR00266 family)